MNTSTNMYLEHANIGVANIDASIAFFQTAFPDFKVRGGGENNGDRWAHVGNDQTYLALSEYHTSKQGQRYACKGFNHIGFVVNDVNGLAKRLMEAGYVRSYPRQEQTYRIREYFDDPDGIQYEFVEYLSDKPEERNDYSE